MLTLHVSGMTCGGCVNAITRAIQTHDANARVEADLATQAVRIETTLNLEETAIIVTNAGFPVQK